MIFLWISISRPFFKVAFKIYGRGLSVFSSTVYKFWYWALNLRCDDEVFEISEVVLLRESLMVYFNKLPFIIGESFWGSNCRIVYEPDGFELLESYRFFYANSDVIIYFFWDYWDPNDNNSASSPPTLIKLSFWILGCEDVLFPKFYSTFLPLLGLLIGTFLTCAFKVFAARDYFIGALVVAEYDFISQFVESIFYFW